MRFRLPNILGAVGLTMVLAVGAAMSAEISPVQSSQVSGQRTTVIEIKGDLVVGDILKFQQISKSLPPQTVVRLSSQGGSLSAGIEIGKSIAATGFATAVTDVCASSCALAWLAGTPRILSPSAKIGFHLAYKSATDTTESGAGNALVGAYVAGLGFGENVVRYVTSAAPVDMQWLTERDAQLLGINIVIAGDSENEDAPEAPSEDQAEPFDPTSAAIELIRAVIHATANSDSDALDTVKKLYADNVFYFGEMKSKGEVYSDKMKYLKRWPYRAVSLRDSTVASSCRFSRCKVTGIYDWSVGNTKGLRKSGSAAFVYEFEIGDELKITTEGGEVLSRY